MRPVAKAFVDKHRSGGVVSGDVFAGNAEGATALIIDDLISSGTTLLRAAQAAHRAGARRVLALVAHALLMKGSEEVVAHPVIERLITTDSIAPLRASPGPMRDKIEVLSCAPLLAETIRRLHEEKSLSDLLVF